MLFETAVEMYMTDRAKRLRATTLEGYESAIRKHIAPAWTGRDVESITHEELQSWVDSIPTAGAATKALKMLQQVYRWAIKTYELEIFDPTQGVELPQRPIYRREVMTAKEVAHMLREAVGQPWEAVVILAASLGLRPSEACGVDWSDIDWRSGWVHIQRGAHTLQSGETVEYPCKTRLSDRFLKLPRWAMNRLRQIRGQRRRGRVRGELTPRQVYTRFKRFLKSIGLGRCSIEGLRHSWATLAIGAGAALADVSVTMGHTTTKMVMEHYLMSTRAIAKRAIDAAGKAIGACMEAAGVA